MRNFETNKKILSLLTAGMILITPLTANAKTKKGKGTENQISIKQVIDQFDLDTFNSISNKGAKYVNKRIKYYGEIKRDSKCLTHLVNRQFMDSDDVREILDTMVFDDTTLEGEFATVPYANNLIN